MRAMRRLLPSLLAVCFTTGIASARAEKTLAYEREQVWATAVRFIRVDERLKIVEKDADAGYVLFELHEEKRTFRGSLEIATIITEGRSYTRFVVTVEDRPAYLEVGMLQRLEHKLRVELGSPSPSPTPKPKKDEDAPPKAKDEPKEPPKEKVDPDAPPISPTP
jgi:hypothetical protein